VDILLLTRLFLRHNAAFGEPNKLDNLYDYNYDGHRLISEKCIIPAKAIERGERVVYAGNRNPVLKLNSFSSPEWPKSKLSLFEMSIT